MARDSPPGWTLHSTALTPLALRARHGIHRRRGGAIALGAAPCVTFRPCAIEGQNGLRPERRTRSEMSRLSILPLARPQTVGFNPERLPVSGSAEATSGLERVIPRYVVSSTGSCLLRLADLTEPRRWSQAHSGRSPSAGCSTATFRPRLPERARTAPRPFREPSCGASRNDPPTPGPRPA